MDGGSSLVIPGENTVSIAEAFVQIHPRNGRIGRVPGLALAFQVPAADRTVTAAVDPLDERHRITLWLGEGGWEGEGQGPEDRERCEDWETHGCLEG